ncbi:hypothetical protein FOB64_003041 [Candida albicans]|uniref:Autophagy-related protein 101 n=1 Tax=Candida albicans TaxID=5476 RepID=A0A8H6F302_CANAX|nr:hypothetical protein FOB64_003041 [Candida albicans]
MEFIINVIAERSVLRESLKGIIWTIFFNRLFGPITPVTNEFMNVSYPMANNLPDLDSLIDEKVNRILNQITEVSNQAKINVQFLSKSSNKKKTGWFGNSTYNAQDDLVVWESWLINVESLPLDQVSNGESKNVQTSIQNFANNLTRIYDIADKFKEHIHQSHRLIVLRSPTKLLSQRKSHITIVTTTQAKKAGELI